MIRIVPVSAELADYLPIRAHIIWLDPRFQRHRGGYIQTVTVGNGAIIIYSVKTPRCRSFDPLGRECRPIIWRPVVPVSGIIQPIFIQMPKAYNTSVALVGREEMIFAPDVVALGRSANDGI